MTASEQAFYELYLADKFSSPLDKIKGKLDVFDGRLAGVGKTMLGVFGGGFLLQGADAIISKIGEMATSVVTLASDFEQTQISFRTMLKDGELATQVLNDLTKFAAETPFGQSEVISGAKQLLAYQFHADELIEKFRMLGDVSAGLNVPVGDMVYLFGTLKNQGKAYMKDIMQFAGRGIPIFDELAKVTGKSGEALNDMISDGEVTFEMVDQAFKNMTSQGGIFYNLMEDLSNSLGGKWSNLMDIFEIKATDMGMAMVEPLKKAIDLTIELMELIPKLDFSPIWHTFDQVHGEILGLIGELGSLFGALDDNFTMFEKLTIAVRALAFAFRLTTTPLRTIINFFKMAIEIGKGVAEVFGGLYDIINALATRNWDKIGEGVDRMKQGVKSAFEGVTDVVENEVKGWKKIFADLNDYTKMGGDASAVGKTGPQPTDPWAQASALLAMGNKRKLKGSGDSDKSTAGVEKIKAGTRNITVNIQTIKLADTITSNKADLSDARLQQMLQRAMIAAVNDVNLVGQ